MHKPTYFIRLAAGSVAAVGVTFAIILLVMWMNGLLVEEDPSRAPLTPCVFSDVESSLPENPFAKESLVVKCISPEDAKPLIAQWFEKILLRRKPNLNAGDG